MGIQQQQIQIILSSIEGGQIFVVQSDAYYSQITIFFFFLGNTFFSFAFRITLSKEVGKISRVLFLLLSDQTYPNLTHYYQIRTSEACLQLIYSSTHSTLTIHPSSYSFLWHLKVSLKRIVGLKTNCVAWDLLMSSTNVSST